MSLQIKQMQKNHFPLHIQYMQKHLLSRSFQKKLKHLSKQQQSLKLLLIMCQLTTQQALRKLNTTAIQYLRSWADSENSAMLWNAKPQLNTGPIRHTVKYFSVYDRRKFFMIFKETLKQKLFLTLAVQLLPAA